MTCAIVLKTSRLVNINTIEVRVLLEGLVHSDIRFDWNFRILSGQFWKAPELLRNPNIYGSPKADVYAFAIILFEVIGRKGPFGQIGYEPKEIIELVKQIPDGDEEPFRPDVEYILESGNCADYIVNCLKECWHENPEVRPDFTTIR